jgi:5'-nucleotidase (lipoprotein e(P4) family)
MDTFRASKLALLSAAALSLVACVNSDITMRASGSSAPLTATSSLSQANELRVATWNVEHLAYPINTGCNPRSQSDIDAMLNYVKQVDADIYALQEVASKQALNTLFPDEHWQIFMSSRADSESYTCRGSGRASTQQKVAFAVRKSLVVNDVQSLSEFSLNNPGLRNGLQMNVQTAFGDVSLLNVHMKSGCFVDNYSRSDSEACKVFAQQAPILDRWIEQQERRNTPYIVLGDFNHRLSAAYNHLTQKLLANSDGSSSSLQNTTTDLIGCHPYYPAPIDLIFLGGMASSAISYTTQAHRFESMQVDEMLSDHCAVSLNLSMKLGSLSNAVKWQTTSKEYEFLTRAIYQQASGALTKEFLSNDSWVVIMDVDETILDNSPYQIVSDQRGLKYTPESWANWVKLEEATLVPGASDFMKTVLDMGGKLALITNREKNLDAYTWRNLVASGLPVSVENTCLLGRSQPDINAIDNINIVNDKDLRRQQVQNGKANCYRATKDEKALNDWKRDHQIAMEVGDNIEDFSRITQEGADVTELIKKWPTKLILLPNPTYGSW